jgi:quinone-modifying oxidoreductase subunit QmoB
MRTMTDAFRLDVPILERVNLREHVAWSHEPNNDDTQQLAEDYLTMGLVRAQKSEPLEPNIQDISKTILVIGGGLTGVTAALEAAEAGSEVVLVEQAPKLGGWLASAWKDTPSIAPYRELETPQIAEKARAAQANAKIRVIAGASIEKIAGAPGLFDATVKTGPARRRSASARSCSPPAPASSTRRSSRTSASAPART